MAIQGARATKLVRFTWVDHPDGRKAWAVHCRQTGALFGWIRARIGRDRATWALMVNATGAADFNGSFETRDEAAWALIPPPPEAQHGTE